VKENLTAGRRFKRGKDRRISELTPSVNLREIAKDRRDPGLSWITLFRDTNEAEIHKVIADCEIMVLPAGTPLLRPGDNNANVYILLSGCMAAYLDSDLNPESSLAIVKGECLGEFSAIDGKPVSALVIAVDEVRILKILPDIFWNNLMPMQGVARNLLISLTERMRRSNQITLEAQRQQIGLEYLKQELEVARQLQAGMLPLRRPLFPDRPDIEIAGSMDPADEIGGDLFDAFFVDDDVLFFSIGDVSGHGIPAALFMARTIGLMHISAMGTNCPDKVLQRVNKQLCEGNDTFMFVTLFCGFLNIKSGQLIYSNAGHCAPLLLKNATVTRLPMPKGSLLGIMDNNDYMAMELVLAKGDTLICYTDGVTEAPGPTGAEFSESRLIDIATQNLHLNLEDLIDSVRRSVIHHTESSTLQDDCTLLTLRRPERI
jgi:sigma-B regulation protein RsbU (phosphoserine phosphatase)